MLRYLSNYHLIVMSILLTADKANSQWVAAVGVDSQEVRSFGSHNQYLFAGTSRGAYRSSDEGMTWLPIDSGLVRIDGYPGFPYLYSFMSEGKYFFAGTENGVYVSTDDGMRWSPTVSQPPYRSIGSLINRDSILLVAGGSSIVNDGDIRLVSDIFLSTDNGMTWLSSSTGMPADRMIFTLTSIGTSIVASTDQGIYTSSDVGLTWILRKTNEWFTIRYYFASNDSILAAVSIRGTVCLSSDSGKTWTSTITDTSFAFISSFCIVHNTLVLGATSSGVFLSTDWGLSWRPANEGLGFVPSRSSSITATALLGDFLFVGTLSGIWRRPVSEITGYRAVITSSIPIDFSLEQNFPNPFNPSTEIRYSIPEAHFTTLEVFDLLGRRIMTLLSHYLLPGKYSSKLDASAFPNGVYIYRLTSGLYSSTKKMIVVK